MIVQAVVVVGEAVAHEQDALGQDIALYLGIWSGSVAQALHAKSKTKIQCLKSIAIVFSQKKGENHSGSPQSPTSSLHIESKVEIVRAT